LPARFGWASGIRLYAVLFIVGGLGYLGWIPLPGASHSSRIRTCSWRRPRCSPSSSSPTRCRCSTRSGHAADLRAHPAGAALAASVFGDASGAIALAAAILGGTLAAGSHLAKSGSRMAINTSPEPFSNWAASFGEDVAVGVVLWLAWEHPAVALVVLGLLVLLMLWLIPKVCASSPGCSGDCATRLQRHRGAAGAAV